MKHLKLAATVLLSLLFAAELFSRFIVFAAQAQLITAPSAPSDADVGELDSMATSSGDDPVFARFRKRVAREPEQVVRYWRGGAPLWVSSEHQPAERDVPDCTACGARRHFEFQVRISSVRRQRW